MQRMYQELMEMIYLFNCKYSLLNLMYFIIFNKFIAFRLFTLF